MRKALLFICLLFPCLVSAQTYFEKIIGGNTSQDASGVVQANDGGFVTAGRSIDSFGFYDIFLLKVDSVGDSLWAKSYGGNKNDFPARIRATSDGGFIVSGTTYSFSSQPTSFSDWWLLRLDANGDTLWTKTVANVGNDKMRDAIETSDGHILACGWVSNNSYAAATVRKFDASGQLLHTFILGSGANSYAQSVVELQNGNYMLVGSRFLSTFMADLVELDTTLTYITDHPYDLPSSAEAAEALYELPQGGYLLTAKTGFVLRFDVWLLRLNDQFDTIWTKTFSDTLDINDIDEHFGSALTADSGIVVTGRSLYAGQLKAAACRFDSSGQRQWSVYYGGPTDNSFTDVLLLDDGGFLFAGYNQDSVNFDFDVYLVRVGGDGEIPLPTGISTFYRNDQIRFYPNPVSGTLHWITEESNPERELIVYAANGAVLLKHSITSPNGQLDLHHLSPGIYFGELITEKKSERFKFVVK